MKLRNLDMYQGMHHYFLHHPRLLLLIAHIVYYLIIDTFNKIKK